MTHMALGNQERKARIHLSSPLKAHINPGILYHNEYPQRPTLIITKINIITESSFFTDSIKYPSSIILKALLKKREKN